MDKFAGHTILLLMNFLNGSTKVDSTHDICRTLCNKMENGRKMELIS